MPAYVIAEIEVHDPDTYDQYRKLAPASIAEYGGSYVVRGGAAEKLEGDQDPKRMVVLSFPSASVAKEWIESEQYAPARRMRQASATSRIIVVDGV